MRRKYELVLTRCNDLDRRTGGRWGRCLGWALLVGWSTTAAWAQPQGDLDEFFRSVTDGRVEIVREGLSRNPAWANAELFMGIRPVYRAAVLGREEVLALLIEAGADVNQTTKRGTHAMHAAAQNGHLGILEKLILAGAEIDPVNELGETPLILAVRYGHPKVVERLLAKGASLKSRDRLGRSPLHYAAGLGRLETTQLLLDNGAELGLVDNDGFTPLGLCRTWKRNDFEKAAELLQTKGAPDERPESAWPKPESPAEEPQEVAP